MLVSLVLALLPESWMEEYGKAMRLSTETGLIPALAVVAGAPLAEELVFRGVIQSRLERAMPVWIAIVLQAVLFGFIHGTPVQIGYAFLMGLLFGYIRYRTGSILPVEMTSSTSQIFLPRMRSASSEPRKSFCWATVVMDLSSTEMGSGM